MPSRKCRRVHTVSNTGNDPSDDELFSSLVVLERSDLDDDADEHNVRSVLSHATTSELVTVREGEDGSCEASNFVESDVGCLKEGSSGCSLDGGVTCTINRSQEIRQTAV